MIDNRYINDNIQIIIDILHDRICVSTEEYFNPCNILEETIRNFLSFKVNTILQAFSQPVLTEGF